MRMYYSLVASKESLEIDFHRTEEEMQALIKKEGWVSNKPCKWPAKEITRKFKCGDKEMVIVIKPKTYIFVAEQNIYDWLNKVNTIMSN